MVRHQTEQPARVYVLTRRPGPLFTSCILRLKYLEEFSNTSLVYKHKLTQSAEMPVLNGFASFCS